MYTRLTDCVHPYGTRVRSVPLGLGRGVRDWQRAAVLLGRSSGWMNIGQPLTRRRLLVGARLAIRRASFAISDCWQSPKLRGGLDHTPLSRRCSNISQNCPCIKLDSIRIKQIHLWGMYVPSGVLAYWISIFELKYASERSGLHQPLSVPKPPLHCLTALVEPSWRVSSMSTTRA